MDDCDDKTMIKRTKGAELANKQVAKESLWADDPYDNKKPIVDPSAREKKMKNITPGLMDGKARYQKMNAKLRARNQ